jgi:hypothetical protein
MYVRIRHKYFKKLKKPDHILNNITMRTFCGKFGTWNLDIWFPVSFHVLTAYNGNMLCSHCRSGYIKNIKNKNIKNKNIKIKINK